MRLRFKTILFFILSLFVFCAIVGIGYLFYNEITDDADIVVDGNLTINYMSGKKFKTAGNASMNFSVTNNGDVQQYYYIQFLDIYAQDVSYEVTSSNDIKISNKLKSGIILDQIAIAPNETNNYTLNFNSNQSEKYSGTIQIGLRKNENNIFSEVILSQNSISDKTLSVIGENATLDEGLLPMQDDVGISYYFRGATLKNNVSFAGMNWKIIKVDSDGSVRLVLDGLAESISKYTDSDKEFEKSSIYETLNVWFDEKLKDYSDYIAYNKYCNDITLGSDDKTFIAYTRLLTNKIPTFVCLSNDVNAKIGLLTADEVMLAGGSTKANTNYYLYNKNITNSYYTMTSAISNGSGYFPFVVNPNGSLESNINGTLLRGVRPVITIMKNARVTGTGLIDDPYQIIEN